MSLVSGSPRPLIVCPTPLPPLLLLLLLLLLVCEAQLLLLVVCEASTGSSFYSGIRSSSLLAVPLELLVTRKIRCEGQTAHFWQLTSVGVWQANPPWQVTSTRWQANPPNLGCDVDDRGDHGRELSRETSVVEKLWQLVEHSTTPASELHTSTSASASASAYHCIPQLVVQQGLTPHISQSRLGTWPKFWMLPVSVNLPKSAKP